MSERGGHTPILPVKARYFPSRLLKKLGDVLTVPVTVIEAPAGYGKTTALRHYLENSSANGMPVYWWTVDGIDHVASWSRLC